MSQAWDKGANTATHKEQLQVTQVRKGRFSYRLCYNNTEILQY